MIRVVHPAARENGPDAWLVAWRVRADAATERVIEEWARTGTVRFEKADEELWKELRDELSNRVFYGKCAYCERTIFKDVADSEHYRPKKAVRQPRSAGHVPVRVYDLTGSEAVHPGYFWLALNWWNILPACRGCNALRGKLNQFPVTTVHRLLADAAAPTGVRYAVPGHPNAALPDADELDVSESPLLLNPYRDDPAAHLCFTDMGSVTARTEKGNWSIEVYDLENDELRRARHERQLAAESTFLNAVLYHRKRGMTTAEARARAREELFQTDGIAEGRCEFSAAVVASLDLVDA